ncbi:MAG TPA: hypothetical protein V6C58_19255 [Allocoleopsis sp.]
MKVSKREFLWACSKVIPKLLVAKQNGVHINVPELVTAFSYQFIANKYKMRHNTDNQLIDMAADTVSIIANELATDGYFSFSDKDGFCWEVLSDREQIYFMETYGNLL